MRPSYVRIIELSRQMALQQCPALLGTIEVLAEALMQTEDLLEGQRALYEQQGKTLDEALALIDQLRQSNAALNQALFFTPKPPAFDA